MKCRHCKTELEKVFIDLGEQPPSNSYLTKDQLEKQEKKYPLRVLVCGNCFLVQTEDFVNREEMFSNDYSYFSSQSKSFLKHAKEYVDMICDRLFLTLSSKVIEIASNDGYLLQYFKQKEIPCLGIEPTKSTAEVARQKGLSVLSEFFSEKLAETLCRKIGRVDLVIGNNVIAHVPDINDFLQGVASILSYTGTVTFEFPYLLNLIKNKQFDTIYHEHYSYFSVTSLDAIFETNGLEIYDIEEIPTHGGSLRVYGQIKAPQYNKRKRTVDDFLESEKSEGVTDINYYEGFQKTIEEIKETFKAFINECQEKGIEVIGYGAAAKANTFLNYMGANAKTIPFIIDTTPAKQGKFLPGSHIPIYSEEKLKEMSPDYLIIFPWNFKEEIINRLTESEIVNQYCTFVTFIPTMRIF